MTQTNQTNLKKAKSILRALDHKLRQEILNHLGDGELTVSQLMVLTKQEQAVVSQMLGIIRRANIVTTRREGKFVFYKINEQMIEKINAFTAELIKS